MMRTFNEQDIDLSSLKIDEEAIAESMNEDLLTQTCTAYEVSTSIGNLEFL